MTGAPTGATDVPPTAALRRCWSGEARALSGSFVFADDVRPWNWLELDAVEAAKLWSLLATFVAYLNRRYGEHPDRRVPPCWAEHGALVEELTTLVFARWQAFESPLAAIDAAQRWHSYTLPGFYQRTADWLGDGLLACQQGRHREVPDLPEDSAEPWATEAELRRNADVEQRDAPGSAT